MIERRLRELPDSLQGKKPHLPHFLSEIYLDGIRGLDNLRIMFDYPVSVIAGGNATGKSTVLFAAACAYKVPGAGTKDFVPSTLFPYYNPKLGDRQDILRRITDEESGKIIVRPPYRDVIQNALYGRSSEVLKLLCEDEIAEGILKGVFDLLLSRERIKWESVQIGRDTGASEFPMHARALAKFGQLQNTIFILDGDQQDQEIAQKIQAAGPGINIPILFLPGSSAPENWVWDKLRQISAADAAQLGTDPGVLSNLMGQLDATYAPVSESPETPKTKLRTLSEHLSREAPEVCRILARLETEQKESDIQPFVEELEQTLLQWRE